MNEVCPSYVWQTDTTDRPILENVLKLNVWSVNNIPEEYAKQTNKQKENLREPHSKNSPQSRGGGWSYPNKQHKTMIASVVKEKLSNLFYNCELLSPIVIQHHLFGLSFFFHIIYLFILFLLLLIFWFLWYFCVFSLWFSLILIFCYSLFIYFSLWSCSLCSLGFFILFHIFLVCFCVFKLLDLSHPCSTIVASEVTKLMHHFKKEELHLIFANKINFIKIRKYYGKFTLIWVFVKTFILKIINQC